MKILSLLLLCLLVACSSEDSSKSDRARHMPDKASVNRPSEAPSPEERQKADAALQFANMATGALTEGYYGLPNALRNNANIYLRHFRLPKKPAVPRNVHARALRARPAGIFNEQEEAALTAALDDMDRALGSMLQDYDALQRYVNDDDIIDNGREGERLGKRIAAGHAQFMRARRTWLEMLDQKAAAAQKILLGEHPLRRQILDAEKMFSIFRETTAQVALEEPNRENIAALRDELDRVLDDAKKPPFPAAPQLERAYREFLKKVDAYSEALQTGLLEGFFTLQKKTLAACAAACREAYNAFVTEANRHPVELRPRSVPPAASAQPAP